MIHSQSDHAFCEYGINSLLLSITNLALAYILIIISGKINFIHNAYQDMIFWFYGCVLSPWWNNLLKRRNEKKVMNVGVKRRSCLSRLFYAYTWVALAIWNFHFLTCSDHYFFFISPSSFFFGILIFSGAWTILGKSTGMGSILDMSFTFLVDCWYNFVLHTGSRELLYCTLYTIHYIVYTIHYAEYTIQYEVGSHRFCSDAMFRGIPW